MDADYVEVCRESGVNIRDGRVAVGPCYRTVSVVYTLVGVAPLATVSPTDGRTFFVPRVNTFRPDGQFLIFFNNGGTFTEKIRVFPCDSTTNRYGLDVFAFAPQVVNVTSVPVVPVTVTSEQNGEQEKHQLVFTTDATVYVNISNNPNGRFVTFSVDMSAPIAAGTHSIGEWVEVRGPFNNFGGGDLYRLSRSGNVYSGTFLIVGAAASTVTYKFYGQRITWEPRADRTLTLGPVQQGQTVPAAVWNV
jgi:hypothetical protein